MKIVCLAKIVPDVDKFKYDFEKNTVVRENVRMILNPEDAKSIGFALEVKNHMKDVGVEVVTMAPTSARPILNDLIRVGVDKVTFLSDVLFSGSDSYATSKILGKCLKGMDFDLLLTGTHAIDGDTSHVPSQIGEILGLTQISNVLSIDKDLLSEESVTFSVDDEASLSTYEMVLPGILSLLKTSKYKMPYIKYADINKDVSSQINIITNSELGFNKADIGIKGSLTKVNRTFVKEYEKRNKTIVSNDDEGIEIVYEYLKDKGFI